MSVRIYAATVTGADLVVGNVILEATDGATIKVELDALRNGETISVVLSRHLTPPSQPAAVSRDMRGAPRRPGPVKASS